MTWIGIYVTCLALFFSFLDKVCSTVNHYTDSSQRLFPNPEDSQTYYECRRRQYDYYRFYPFLRQCSPGTRFNANTKRCDHPRGLPYSFQGITKLSLFWNHPPSKPLQTAHQAPAKNQPNTNCPVPTKHPQTTQCTPSTSKEPTKHPWRTYKSLKNILKIPLPCSISRASSNKSIQIMNLKHIPNKAHKN